MRTIKPMRRGISLATLATIPLITACTTSRTFVLEPASAMRTHSLASIEHLPSTVTLDPSLASQFETRFESQLSRRLSPEASIVPPEAGDLNIRYRFVLYDAGSTATRVGAGVASLAGSPFYGLGDGALGVDVIFTNSDGRVLGRIVVDGPISGAFASADGALATAAASIARYAKQNFLIEPALQTARTDGY